MAKEAELIAWLREAGAVAIGYSGGVDSVYLAAVAIEALGSDSVIGVTGRSASYPAAQWQAARDSAAAIGLEVLELDTNELADPSYAANPSNRCYFCKTELWSLVVPAARERGISTVVDGTNADDMKGHRPGAAAALEQGVRSPLAELGFTKGEIREFSRARGLPTSEQPSSPCLSSRIPFGIAVTSERLALIEAAEAGLRSAGITGDLRVRHQDDVARIELADDELAAWLGSGSLDVLADAVLEAGYARVCLDLRGFRSGSLSKRAASGQSVASDAAGLREALSAAGVDCSVEALGSLALLSVASPPSLADPRARSTVTTLANQHGFAFAALELSAASTPSHAAVSRD